MTLDVSEDSRDSSASFESLAPEFAPRFHRGSVGWVNVLRFESLRTNPKWVLNLPKDFSPESARRLRLGGDDLFPSREGMVLPQHFKDHREYIKVLTGREAMVLWLNQHGVRAEISSSGRVVEQVLDGTKGVRGARLLADRATLELLDDMAKSVRRFRDGEIEEYPDRSASAEEWTALIARRQQDMWSRNLKLDDFIAAGTLKLGLLIECSHCTYSNWFGIAGLDEALTCERCHKEYAFPQGSLNYRNSPWRFRVVGPFAVPNYADGAYATVLALRVFAETLVTGDVTLTYAPGLVFKRGRRQAIRS